MQIRFAFLRTDRNQSVARLRRGLRNLDVSDARDEPLHLWTFADMCDI